MFVDITERPSRPTSDADASPVAILERARRRAVDSSRPYAGDLTPAEAGILAQAGCARIIDVRSRYEHEFVGRIEGSPLVEWRIYESDGSAAGIRSRPNERFVEQLRAVARPDETLLFLCRSGVRSQGAAAAATAAGFSSAFNILEGFEGNPDERKQRSRSGGWRHAGLPWIQG
ncbi:MAG: rhodanese-like domain-containing protein [Burkholderiales bacterium]|nr:rhodanese-like domain-containing protein [Burkholderiales bacterium]